jgi:hypothetical protein
MTVVKRITARQRSAIEEIARREARDPKNVLDLIIDRGLYAHSQGNWPTSVQQQQHRR